MRPIRFIQEIQTPYAKEYNEEPIMITEVASVCLALSPNMEEAYRQLFRFLVSGSIGEKPELCQSWFEGESALALFEKHSNFDNLEDELANIVIGHNYGDVWRNHTLYGDQISAVISNMIFNIYRCHTVYEKSCLEFTGEESIDIDTFEPVLKTDYTHYYMRGKTINALVSAESLTIEEYVLHHNLRHMMLRFLTQQKGMEGLVTLGDITFIIKNFNYDKFKGKKPFVIHLGADTSDLFAGIADL